jgi:hypothetical protein
MARTPGVAKPGGPETADDESEQEEQQPGSPAESPRQARGRAASPESLGRLQECIAEIQGSSARGAEARLSAKSQQANQETIAACTRLENVAEKLEGAASRFFEQVQSKLLAPEAIRSSLDAYHGWLLQRCGDEETRLRIIERLPDLFDLVEVELAARRSAGDGPAAPERQSAVVELVKLQIRIRAWQESVGLIRFPNPGDAFDATRHDVESVVETDDDAIVDSVKEVLRSGYRLGSDGPILRPARVVRWVRSPGK